MTGAAALAFGAAAAGVAGAWDLLSELDASRPAARIRATLAPLRRAGAEGRAPTPPEQRRLGALFAACLLAAGWLAGGALLGVAAAAAGPLAAVAAVRMRRDRYVAAVASGAAPAARAMAGALAAGRSVRAAVREAASGVDGPAGSELKLAARALDMGEPTESVLERLRRRAGGGTWDTLVAALLLQRDAGGDLATLLRELASSLEAAARAERDARAATAQSRATARIVGGLPVLAASAAELASPNFLAGLLGHPLSVALGLAAGGLQVTALVLIRRIVR